jgi:hypothetical protein
MAPSASRHRLCWFLGSLSLQCGEPLLLNLRDCRARGCAVVVISSGEDTRGVKHHHPPTCSPVLRQPGMRRDDETEPELISNVVVLIGGLHLRLQQTVPRAPGCFADVPADGWSSFR